MEVLKPMFISGFEEIGWDDFIGNPPIIPIDYQVLLIRKIISSFRGFNLFPEIKKWLYPLDQDGNYVPKPKQSNNIPGLLDGGALDVYIGESIMTTYDSSSDKK
eukprot:CAMPEP_0204868464 /NCGR_PEP_ID=MMETSP1348-20121228/26664_1 /ASSEMBLY_ACC=CAM_ASM_000700 /TAXON_ID=215587 /ORGANISM="Aplanochytrium stocchinoi, Strain GSBS06" /LENGTH=103 /DNA_ID=CAMNT_0052021397 /DNA_START=12 /DNA_END=320 /DNA_ORIENTATION=+